MKMNYKKFGLERARDLDFYDDGAYFRAYRAGENKSIRVTVTTYEGEYFISASANDFGENQLPYIKPEVRETLPGYNKLDMLNGVPGESLTDEKMQELVTAIAEYEKAYIAKAKELQLI